VTDPDKPPLGATLCAGTAAAFVAVTPMALLLGLSSNEPG
jgi:hypothetical protein